MSDVKTAYDRAAELLCEHVLDCPDCTMTGPACETGEQLREDENTAWYAYREGQP